MLHARSLAPLLMLACSCASSPPPVARKAPPPTPPIVVASAEPPPPADELPMRDIERAAPPSEQALGTLQPVSPEPLAKQAAPKKKHKKR
jgi:hypothetical protein